MRTELGNMSPRGATTHEAEAVEIDYTLRNQLHQLRELQEAMLEAFSTISCLNHAGFEQGRETQEEGYKILEHAYKKVAWTALIGGIVSGLSEIAGGAIQKQSISSVVKGIGSATKQGTDFMRNLEQGEIEGRDRYRTTSDQQDLEKMREALQKLQQLDKSMSDLVASIRQTYVQVNTKAAGA